MSRLHGHHHGRAAKRQVVESLRAFEKRGNSALLLATCLLLAVSYLALRPYYYRWALSGETVGVTLYCDTAMLSADDCQAYAQYDRVALSPLARLLGILQQRPPETVLSLHSVALPTPQLLPHAVLLSGVPVGPLTRLSVSSGGRRYYAPVTDRQAKDGRLYVHLD